MLNGFLRNGAKQLRFWQSVARRQEIPSEIRCRERISHGWEILARVPR